MMAPIPDGATSRPDGPGPALVRGAPGPASLTFADHAIYSQAFDAASRADWNAARAMAARGSSAVSREIIEWLYLLDEGGGASFEQINTFLNQHPNWPRREGLLARAEKSMPPLEARQVVDWYSTHEPVTGTGAIRLGEALVATGKTKEGTERIRSGWTRNTFSPFDEADILRRHADLLRPADQSTRLDLLLARDDTGGAKRQLARVSKDAKRLGEVRLKLKATPKQAKKLLAGLPASLRKNPELMLDEARALRLQGDDAAAWSLIQRAGVDKDDVTYPERWWAERHIMARDALKAGKPDIAYQLASKRLLDSGSGFADAEFLSGWIALRFQHRPSVALKHFQALAKGVSYPISLSRAYYWTGRAEEDLKHNAEAVAAYRRAAAYADTFYGQLALARIDANPMLRLNSVATTPSAAETATFEADDRVQAIRVLGDLGERDTMRLFVIRAANDFNDAKRLAQLAELMVSLGDRGMSLKVAKLASYQNIALQPYLDPVMPVPAFLGGGAPPEPALVLGLTRQESEFDPTAVSGAGARGLMQLLPSSAKIAASKVGLAYKLDDLTADPQYNMKLGMTELGGYLDLWNGSYILSAASYNAGLGNVRRWVQTYGDPREATVDPIDWIESIPFGETRNYVQRVLENTNVYRTRLGNDAKLTIMADLTRPYPPKSVVLSAAPAAATSAAVPTPVEKPAETEASAAH